MTLELMPITPITLALSDDPATVIRFGYDTVRSPELNYWLTKAWDYTEWERCADRNHRS